MSRVVLGPVRFSYANLFKPVDRNNTGRAKYSLTVLMPKDNKQLMATLNQAIEQAKQEGLQDKFNGSLPPNLKTTIHDGDGVRQDGKPYGEECHGHLVMTCTTGEEYPPQVIAGKDRHPAMPDEVKSGDYGYVSVNFAPYDNSGSKGIGSYLNNVYKTKSGKPLGTPRSTANDDFGNLNLGDDAFDSYEVDPLTGQPITVNAAYNNLANDDDVPF